MSTLAVFQVYLVWPWFRYSERYNTDS